MDATSSLTRRKPPAEAPRGSTTLRLAVGSSKTELPLPRAVHRLSLLLNVIRRLGWLLITKGLPSALLLLRDALRAVLELVGALGARRAQFVGPARPPLCGIALTTSHPHASRARRQGRRLAAPVRPPAQPRLRVAQPVGPPAALVGRRDPVARLHLGDAGHRRRRRLNQRTRGRVARPRGASSRRSSSSTGRSWAGHDDDRAACDLGCLSRMCPRYVCVWSVERGAMWHANST